MIKAIFLIILVILAIPLAIRVLGTARQKHLWWGPHSILGRLIPKLKYEPQPTPGPQPNPVPEPNPPLPPEPSDPYPVIAHELPIIECSCLELMMHSLPDIEMFFKLLYESGVAVTRIFTTRGFHPERTAPDGTPYVGSIYALAGTYESHGRHPYYDWTKTDAEMRDKVVQIAALAKKYKLKVCLVQLDGCGYEERSDYRQRGYMWNASKQYAENFGGMMTGGKTDDKFHPGDDVLKHIDKYGPQTIWYWYKLDWQWWIGAFGTDNYFQPGNEIQYPDPVKPDDEAKQAFADEWVLKFHQAEVQLLCHYGVAKDRIICNPFRSFDGIAALGTKMEMHGVSTADKFGDVMNQKTLWPHRIPAVRMAFNGDGPDKYAAGVTEANGSTKEATAEQAKDLRAALKTYGPIYYGTWLRSCEDTPAYDLTHTERSRDMMRALAGK